MANEDPSLPNWASRFLKLICPDEFFEEIEGDLIQRHQRCLRNRGLRNAKWKLFVNVIRYFRPGIIFRNKISINIDSLSMLPAYFTLAGRHLLKNRIFSMINILGLSIAIAAFIFIIAYVTFETSYDEFHASNERIYRVALKQSENGSLTNTSARNFPGSWNFLNESIPEVEYATRFMKIPANTGFLFGHNNKVFNEWGGYISADTNFFKVFPSLLIRGDISTVLKSPNSIVISESIGRKVFGDTDPIGQRLDRLEENGEGPLLVTGILKDIPLNSHFHVNFVSKLEEVWPEVVQEDWNSTLIFTYALLRENADPGVIEAKLNELFVRAAKDTPKIRGSQAFLQPLKNIHLHSHLNDEYQSNGSATLVYLLLGIGVTILVMGWVNYINIETARFLRRAREVGVRRIIGSQKADLAIQFLIEFFCINILALTFAAAHVIIFIPWFTQLTAIPFDISVFHSPNPWWIALMFFATGSVIAGIYPGLYLINLNPAYALKGTFSPQKSRGFIRRPLLVVQFSASIILIAFFLVINAQLDYMQHTDKKIAVDQVISIRNPVAYSNRELVDKYNSFKLFQDRLLQNPSIGMVTTSSAIPGTEVGFTYVDLIKRSMNDPYDPVRYKTIFVGENFIPLYDIRILAGRNFDAEQDGEWRDPWERKDWLKIILNEKAVAALGFKSPQEAVNQTVKFKAFNDFEDYEIIGVIADYHHEAVKKEVYPTILKVNYNSYQQVYYSVKLNAGAYPQQAINDIERSWKEIFPGHPFQYFFLNDYYDQQFKSERQFSQVFSVFSAVAIFIACLGILGMALFEAHARIKEISIRKILGASVVSLIALLSKDQVRCITVSCLVSFPLVWLGADVWLSSYPSRTGVSLLVFGVPLLIVSGVVAGITFFQTRKAAAVNPVEYLKSE